MINKIKELLGKDADSLLGHKCTTIPKENLHLPGPDFVDRIWKDSDRSPNVLRNMKSIFSHGRLSVTGYLSNIVKLAIEGGCNAVASTLGVLGSVSRKYAHRIPFILKFNHNELLTYPNKYDQIIFGSIDQAFNMGCTAVGATIYFGSDEATRQIQEVSQMFSYAHELGMVTILWCYLRNPAFNVKGDKDYHVSADLTGQANHLGATIEADIVKQKLPENNGGFNALKFGKTSKLVYEKLTTDHPIDLCRYQVANGYMGRVGLINSGGASTGKGESDLKEAVTTAVINKRAGGMGLISGRKAFQKPMKDGVELLNAIQDVYAEKEVTVA